jgi:hypothetical protein
MDKHDNDQSKLITTQNEGNSEQNVNGNYPSNNDNGGSESGEQATKVTDDSIRINPPKEDMNEEEINKYLNGSDAVPRPPVNPEQIGPLSTISEPSLSVSETNAQGENSSSDQARTTTSQGRIYSGRGGGGRPSF